MMNIVCDDIAINTTAMALRGEDPPPGPVMELPYAGSRAMLWIKQIRITSKYKAEIYKAQRTRPMRIYCNKRYVWTGKVFNMILWDMVGMVWWKLTHTK